MAKSNVLRADEEGRQFMIEADAEGLRQRLSPELIWTHSSGAVEDRESVIEAIVHKSGYAIYLWTQRKCQCVSLPDTGCWQVSYSVRRNVTANARHYAADF